MNNAQAQAIAPTLLNGLAIDALTQAVNDVAEDASRAPLTFRAKTTWQGQLRSRTDIATYDLGGQQIVRRHQILADEPLELLGDNTAPNPQDLLLAAVAACMTVGFVVGATSEGIQLDALEIDTACTLDLRGIFALDPAIPPGTRKVTYTIRVRGNGTQEQFAAIHERVTMTSPNYYHLANAIPFESELIVG